MLKEIFVWGISRCGNHALTEFLFGHYYHTFPKNFLRLDSRTLDTTLRRHHIFLNNYLSDQRYNIDGPRYKLPEPKLRIPFPTPKHGSTQIISYENGSCKEQERYTYRSQTDICRDPTKLKGDTGRRKTKKYALVILRDPFNWFASWKTGIVKVDQQELEEGRARRRIELWIQYAKTFFLDPTEDWFAVSYNQFCKDQEYRQLISKYIEEPFSDKGINRVSSMGSSFDRFKFQNNAKKMQTLSRWKTLDNSDWKLLNNYSELAALSSKIFKFDPRS